MFILGRVVVWQPSPISPPTHSIGPQEPYIQVGFVSKSRCADNKRRGLRKNRYESWLDPDLAYFVSFPYQDQGVVSDTCQSPIT